jgi:hypothetical protein
MSPVLLPKVAIVWYKLILICPNGKFTPMLRLDLKGILSPLELG